MMFVLSRANRFVRLRAANGDDSAGRIHCVRTRLACRSERALPESIVTVAGMPSRRRSSRSSTNTRTSYTRLVRSSSVCTVFGVNSAVDEMKPTLPRRGESGAAVDRHAGGHADIDAAQIQFATSRRGPISAE